MNKKTKQTLTKPRKNPVQNRAQETVDTLLEATARILVKDSYDRTSTNRISKEAGISVGSLYQYFPGKEAIVAALVERQVNKDAKVIKAKLLEVENDPTETALRAVMLCLIHLNSRDRKLRKVFIEQVPKFGSLKKVYDTEKEVAALIYDRLSKNHGKLRPHNRELVNFVLVKSIMGVIYGAIFEESPFLEKEELADEMTRLIMGYVSE